MIKVNWRTKEKWHKRYMLTMATAMAFARSLRSESDTVFVSYWGGVQFV